MKITKEITVQKILDKYPQSIQIFAALNIDSCCGAQQTIEEGCTGAGKNVEAVVQMLKEIFEGDNCGNCDGCGCA